MEANFPQIIAFLFSDIEGGFQCIPSDKGNWTGGQVGVGSLVGTKFGISAASYPAQDIPKLTPEDASSLYHRDYWIPCGCPEMASGLDAMVFDDAVNSGKVNALIRLQSLIGIKRDGLWGPVTRASVRAEDPSSLLVRLASARRTNYQNLAERSPATYAGFLEGWMDRIDKVEKLALALQKG